MLLFFLIQCDVHLELYYSFVTLWKVFQNTRQYPANKEIWTIFPILTFYYLWFRMHERSPLWIVSAFLLVFVCCVSILFPHFTFYYLCFSIHIHLRFHFIFSCFLIPDSNDLLDPLCHWLQCCSLDMQWPLCSLNRQRIGNTFLRRFHFVITYYHIVIYSIILKSM